MSDRIATESTAPATDRRPPAVRAVPTTTPRWTHPLARTLYLLAVFTLPVQLEIAAARAVLQSRLPPGDILLALSVILAPASVRLVRRPVALLPLALPLVLSYGAVMAIVMEGHLTSHSLNVKLLGSIVLVVTGIVTVAYAREGYGAVIMRTLLSGVAFWAVIGYIDWRVADIFPWLDPDVSSRFGGLQFDPNNAGALFGMSALMSWRYGARLFARRWVWALVTVWLAVALALSLSRGAYIGTTAGLLVVLTVDRVSAERAMRYLAAGVVILAFLAASGFVASAVDDFTRRPDTVTSRGSFVEEGIDGFVDSNGLGMGLGTFLERRGKIIHNTAAWLLLEMSLPGLVLFAAMVSVPFSQCLRLRHFDHEFAMALLAAHVTMVVASVGIEALYQRGWWVVIGMTALPTEAVMARARQEPTGAAAQA